MFSVIGYSGYDKFRKEILSGVSEEDAKRFVDRCGGIYKDNHGFSWYLEIINVFFKSIKK